MPDSVRFPHHNGITRWMAITKSISRLVVEERGGNCCVRGGIFQVSKGECQTAKRKNRLVGLILPTMLDSLLGALGEQRL